MKTTLLLLVLTLSSQVYATCSDDFNDGFNEYNFAARYFDKGVASYNKAVELSQSGNPVFVQICNHLVASVSGFAVANDSYKNCTTAFEGAMTSCSGQDSAQAATNRDVCVGNQSIASDNHVTLQNLLKNTCYKGTKSVAPMEMGVLNEDIL